MHFGIHLQNSLYPKPCYNEQRGFVYLFHYNLQGTECSGL